MNNIITGNSNTGTWSSQAGGGIYINNASPHISNNTITSNDSNWGGGICIVGNSAPVIDRNRIQSNTGSSGSGIHITNNSSPIVVNNIIAGNEAYYEFGGGIIINDSAAPSVINNTIVNNYYGGIRVNSSSSVTIKNNILWGNDNDLDGSGLNCSAVTYSDIGSGVCTGEGYPTNISADPLFLSNGDYRLTTISSCIDTGTPIGALTHVCSNLSYDIDGQKRPQREGYDMGAHETAPPYTLTVHTTGSGYATSNPPGIDCRGCCTAEFVQGDPVVLTAVPDSGQSFIGWSDLTGDLGNENPITITKDEDYAIEVEFSGCGGCCHASSGHIMLAGNRPVKGIFDSIQSEWKKYEQSRIMQVIDPPWTIGWDNLAVNVRRDVLADSRGRETSRLVVKIK